MGHAMEPHRRRIAAWIIAAVALGAFAGRAGEASAQSTRDGPAVVPPRLKDPAQVPYPEGAHGDASVVLILTVDKDGTVRSVEIASGDEPFASAAKQAAARLRFSPATREGKPVAARIRFPATF